MNIKFRLVPLKIGDVETEVRNALDRALSIQFDSPKFCFMEWSCNIQSNKTLHTAEEGESCSVEIV